MWGLALAVTLSAAGHVKLGSPGLTGVNVTPQVLTFFSDHLAQQLVLRGVLVMTSTEIQSMLGLERQKQLLGCSDAESAACMAELANALGVDGVITGTIGKLDERYQISLKIVSSADARTLALYTGSAGSEREVLGTLVEASIALAEQLSEKLPREPRATATASGGGRARRFWWAPAAVGVVGLVVGAMMMGLVSGQLNTLRTATAAELDYAGAMRLAANANTQQTVAIISFAIGGVALAAAGALVLFGGRDVAVAPQVTATGAGVTLAGRWP